MVNCSLAMSEGFRFSCGLTLVIRIILHRARARLCSKGGSVVAFSDHPQMLPPRSRLPCSQEKSHAEESGVWSLESRKSREHSRLQTPDSRLQTPDSRLQTPDSRLLTPDSRLRLQTPDS